MGLKIYFYRSVGIISVEELLRLSSVRMYLIMPHTETIINKAIIAHTIKLRPFEIVSESPLFKAKMKRANPQKNARSATPAAINVRSETISPKLPIIFVVSVNAANVISGVQTRIPKTIIFLIINLNYSGNNGIILWDVFGALFVRPKSSRTKTIIPYTVVSTNNAMIPHNIVDRPAFIPSSLPLESACIYFAIPQKNASSARRPKKTITDCTIAVKLPIKPLNVEPPIFNYYLLINYIFLE